MAMVIERLGKKIEKVTAHQELARGEGRYSGGALLARRRLISSAALRRRAEEALHGYVGETTRVQGSIELAVRIVSDIETHSGKSRR